MNCPRCAAGVETLLDSDDGFLCVACWDELDRALERLGDDLGVAMWP